MDTSDLDKRRNAYRGDLAAESLRGKVAAPRYAAGEARRVADSAVPLRGAPDTHASWTPEVLFGESVALALRLGRRTFEGGRGNETFKVRHGLSPLPLDAYVRPV